MNKPRHGKRVRIVGFAALFLIAGFAIALVVLFNADWNRAKPWLNAHFSEALDRPFTIQGDVTLTWRKQAWERLEPGQDWHGIILWPRFAAEDIHIAHPQAFAQPEQPDMVNIKRVTFAVNPLGLLNKKISIPVMRFDSPVITLLRNADGENNWTFENKPSRWQLDLHRIVLSKGSVHLKDAVKHIDVTADVESIEDRVYGVEWQLTGTLNGEPISGSGMAGTALSLQRQTSPYPIMANLGIKQNVIAIEGTLTKPTDLAAFDLRLKLSGTSMARLYALSGIVLPETRPFATEGHLKGTLGPQGGHWIYEKFTGKVGSSDLDGSLDYRSQQPRGLLSGTVVSRVLHVSDLAPLIGADSNASKAERGVADVQPAGKALPVEKFRPERWTSIDADINFSVGKVIRVKELPINKLTTHLRLQDGVLTLSPLNFDMAGGNLSSDITLDGSGKTAIKAKMKVAARHLKLKELFPALPPLHSSIGEINGDAALSAVGISVGSLLGASNGEVRALINEGTVSKLLLEQMGLNIGSIIVTNVVGDRQVKLNCMATDFAVTNGVMQARSFVVDTDAAISNVGGSVSLVQEQLDLKINTRSKGLRVLSLRAPIYVRGSFLQPKVEVDKRMLAARAAGALALGAVAAPSALLPLVTAGPGETSECARLLAEARVKPKAPPPGKRKGSQ